MSSYVINNVSPLQILDRVFRANKDELNDIILDFKNKYIDKSTIS